MSRSASRPTPAPATPPQPQLQPGHAAATTAATAQRHSKNLPHRGAGALPARDAGRGRLRRAARRVLVEPFLHLRHQGRTGADLGRRVRARGDPPARARPLRRHAARGRAASGHAVLPRQPAVARTELARRRQPQARAERESRARNHGAAHARRRRRLHPGRRHVARAHHHRLDLRRAAGPDGAAGQLRVQRQCARARPADPARQDL